MATTPSQFEVTVIGAGMAGSLMAAYLARRGFRVKVFERRADMRKEPVERGRSINMTLAARGLKALEDVGVLAEIMRNTTPLRGRMLHTTDGSVTFQPYGKDDHEVIHSIMRNDLNMALMNLADSYPNVEFVFNKQCVRLDKDAKTVQFKDTRTGEELFATSDLIIGADGAFSTVRQQMHRGERAQYVQDFLEWGYKELTIPPGPDGSFAINNKGLHIWPRGNCMLMAMPNWEGSFTCTCILPFEGESSFESLKSGADVVALFQQHFPDALPLIPMLAENFLRNPTVTMVTTNTYPWYYKDSVVLLGDACHAVVPFYGQGMNAAFEDCSVLDACIGRHMGDWKATFAEYQMLRKRHTDALAELSKENFIELREKVRSPLFVARKNVDIIMNKLFPKWWVPLYTLISHTTVPIADALDRCRTRNRIAKWLGIDLLLMTVAAFVLIGNLFRRLPVLKEKSYVDHVSPAKTMRQEPGEMDIAMTNLPEYRPEGTER
jgi:kynurenine 3-monooxygenase